MPEPLVKSRIGALWTLPFRPVRAGLAKATTGSSTRVTRVVLLADPPSIDRGEITDKGSINQKGVLARRADLVEDLYRRPSPDTVIGASEDA